MNSFLTQAFFLRIRALGKLWKMLLLLFFIPQCPLREVATLRWPKFLPIFLYLLRPPCWFLVNSCLSATFWTPWIRKRCKVFEPENRRYPSVTRLSFLHIFAPCLKHVIIFSKPDVFCAPRTSGILFQALSIYEKKNGIRQTPAGDCCRCLGGTNAAPWNSKYDMQWFSSVYGCT